MSLDDLDHESRSPSSSHSSSGGLPDSVRPGLERSFGMDLSSVRMHTESAEAEGLGAEAFARGSDLHFAPGRFDPSGGRALIAHEVAHLAQQAEGRVAPTAQGKGMAINDAPELEGEADRMADAALAGEVVRKGPKLAPVSSNVAQGYFRYGRSPAPLLSSDARIKATLAYLEANNPKLVETFTSLAKDKKRDAGTLIQWITNQRTISAHYTMVINYSGKPEKKAPVRIEDESDSSSEDDSDRDRKKKLPVRSQKRIAPVVLRKDLKRKEELEKPEPKRVKRVEEVEEVADVEDESLGEDDQEDVEDNSEDNSEDNGEVGEGSEGTSDQSDDSEESEIGEAPSTPQHQLDDTLDLLMEGREVELQSGPWQWKKEGRISDLRLQQLIPGVKSHIKGLVRGALGDPKEGVNDIEGEGNQGMNSLLKLQPSATCMACQTRDDGKFLISGNSMPKKGKSGFRDKLEGYAKGKQVSGSVATERKANSAKETLSVQRPMEDEDDVESFRFIMPNSVNEHAELNHLDYENRHNDSHEKRGELSVSFPCCMLCAATFIVFGHADRLEELGYHEDRVLNWGIPDSLYLPTAFKLFVGNSAAKEIGSNQTAMVRLLQLLAGAHEGWSKVSASKGGKLEPSQYAYQERKRPKLIPQKQSATTKKLVPPKKNKVVETKTKSKAEKKSNSNSDESEEDIVSD